MKHSGSFYYDLEIGEKGEDWIKQIFSQGSKVEVKTDFMAHATGNLFVEVYSRGKKSGISTTIADYWIFIIYYQNLTLILPTDKLKKIIKQNFSSSDLRLGGDNNTSLGILLPIKLILCEI